MRMRFLFVVGLLVLIAGLVSALSQRPKNLIIISVDTLRADHLGAYGYSRKTSPNIDELVARGTLFMNAITQVPLTTPSFCSMMTSRYPHQTGSMRNGIPMLPENQTLAEILNTRGYTTAAVLSNWPLKAHLSGLDKGFDMYDENFHQKRWLFFNDERDAEGVSDNAIEWLEEESDEPFFIWVHYSDPHSPYLLHDEFNFRKKGDLNADRIKIADYDSEIAYADFHIGRLMKKIDQLKLADNSLIVFVADHGESLGEHKYWGHGRRVYQPCLQVPFAMIGPGIPKGIKERANVQLLDMAPTILGYLGLPKGNEMMGLDILPSILQAAPYPERTLYYETYPGALPMEEVRDLKEVNKPIWVGFREGDRKVMYSLRFQKWETYQLDTDPGETDNIFKADQPRSISDTERVLGWYKEWKKHGMALGRTDKMSEEDRAQLEALGYVDK